VRYIALGMKRDCALIIVGITRHQYYYKPKSGKKRGRPPSTQTIKLVHGEAVFQDNQLVVDSIIKNHKDPDLKYGYIRMTQQLKQEKFIINHKKVNKLMAQNQLLALKVKTKKTMQNTECLLQLAL